MRRAKLYCYSLPMEAGVILRHQRLKSRDGLVIHLQEGQRDGWGEISPLPEFSFESLDGAEQEAKNWLANWVKDESLSDSALPSVAFGCSCALAELNQRLPQAADYRKVPLCNGDPDELLDVLNSMPSPKTAKVKVGLYEAVRDGMVVNTLLDAIPDLTLRLDANRSWSIDKAYGFAKYVNDAFRARIDFLEEPCKTRDESRTFARETGISIAWDESVREKDFVVRAEPHLKAIIIKPTLTGSIDYCRSLIDQAHAQGLTAVISSSIESSLGLTQLARLAHWLTPNVIPGLDTLDLMQAQLIRSWPDSNLPLMSEQDIALVWQS